MKNVEKRKKGESRVSALNFPLLPSSLLIYTIHTPALQNDGEENVVKTFEWNKNKGKFHSS